jgi:hypothetical protein
LYSTGFKLGLEKADVAYDEAKTLEDLVGDGKYLRSLMEESEVNR